MTLNFRRGLFRVWIAASIVWLVGGGVSHLGEIQRDVSTLMTTDRSAEPDPVDPVLLDAYRKLEATLADLPPAVPVAKSLLELWEDKDRKAGVRLARTASIILIPPILVLALGWTGIWAGLWIARGFRG